MKSFVWLNFADSVKAFDFVKTADSVKAYEKVKTVVGGGGGNGR